MSKILLADDEPDIRRIAEIALRGLGPVEILNASSGSEALALAQQHHPDLMLLDVMMPGLDGLATLERLKTDPATLTIPVVIVTARASRADQARYLAQGAAAVVVKPFDPSSLADRVAQVLATAAPAEADRRLEAEMAALRADLVARLPQQLHTLARAVDAARGADSPTAARLYAAAAAGDAHRLRGTAGSHGLRVFAEAVGRIEEALSNEGALDFAAVEAAVAAARAALVEVS